MNRYARQEILPECGRDGQKRLGVTHALVVGAGGLGSSVLQFLVAGGIGRITIVDGDIVSMSNLHRQILYRENQVGLSKAETSVQTLRQLNSECALSAVPTPLTPDNVDALLKDADIAVDCADSFAASYILSDACQAQNKPLISASALGLGGYVGGFCGGGPSLRAVFPDLPTRAATCATAGVMGPVVGTLGAMQAQMVFNQRLGLTPSPLGQIISLDFTTYRLGGFRFDNAPEPTGSHFGFIAPSTIQADDFVVELRDSEEAAVPVTPAAIRCAVDQISPSGPMPNSSQRAVLCCRSGLRSWQAARRLQSYWSGEIVLIAMGDTP